MQGVGHQPVMTEFQFCTGQAWGFEVPGKKKEVKIVSGCLLTRRELLLGGETP